jgi:hypothetical protein
MNNVIDINKDLEFKDYPLIKDTTRATLLRYRDNRLEPGSFVRACLENNLVDAIHKADADNLRTIKEIVSWIYWELPANLWGSREKVDAHLANPTT